jgi:hypothetical protein
VTDPQATLREYVITDRLVDKLELASARRHGRDVAELELAAWTIDGTKLWTGTDRAPSLARRLLLMAGAGRQRNAPGYVIG